LFALTSLGGSYWETFFPAILVLGAGMTLTVAPLTTVVMMSVDQDRVGTASGINNAVARVAGVLAIAIFGVVMVSAFGSRLDQNIARLRLPSDVVQEIESNKIKLGGLEAPADIDRDKRALIKDAVRHAFIFGFRIVMFICAGLAAASAGVARLTIPKGKLDTQSAQQQSRAAS
jgi:hypothetical protein